MNFDWSELAFGSKKPINTLKATFIAAPRELSPARFTQLLKEYLPKGNIVLGIAKEPFVLELEDQPQFRTLQLGAVQPIIDKVAHSNSKFKIYTLAYFQRDLPFILDKLTFQRAIFVNGSWYRAFHLRPEFYVLTKQGVEYDLVSPFASEQEAQRYAAKFKPPKLTKGNFTEQEMLALADQRAKQSFAYSEFQIATTIGRKTGTKYKLLLAAHNTIVPYETFAMHYGASREKHFSPMNDLNHYDVVHAEMAMLAQAQQQKVDLNGSTMFINLLPCPTCARTLSLTGIAEYVYRQDHSDGYAVKLFEQTGKKVRRIVS